MLRFLKSEQFQWTKWRLHRFVHRAVARLWWLVHNCVAHPSLSLSFGSGYSQRFHDWTAEKADAAEERLGKAGAAEVANRRGELEQEAEQDLMEVPRILRRLAKADVIYQPWGRPCRFVFESHGSGEDVESISLEVFDIIASERTTDDRPPYPKRFLVVDEINGGRLEHGRWRNWLFETDCLERALIVAFRRAFKARGVKDNPRQYVQGLIYKFNG